MSFLNRFATLSSTLFASSLWAHNAKPVLANPDLLRAIGAKIVAEDSGVAFSYLTPKQEEQVSIEAHKQGHCGGYQALEAVPAKISDLFEVFKAQAKRTAVMESRIERKQNIADALAMVSPAEQSDFVTWFSSYRTRFHKATTSNVPVLALRDKLVALVGAERPYVTVETVDHKTTPQKSIRVHIEGSPRPSEIVAFGAHLDSISYEKDKTAPGADDNGSGSSNVMELLRVMLLLPRPERSIEFFWYAGEEVGLFGSTAIASSYKNLGKDVVAVMQFDMTLHPGSGEGVIATETDFTNPWLRSLFSQLNYLYVKAKIVKDKCGYACSDHASWHQKGFATVYPFESDGNDMNQKLHTPKDLIDSRSSFSHSAIFTKLGLAMALELGNSQLRPPN